MEMKGCDTMESMIKGQKMSEEIKRKIGKANKISLKGNIPWNKGKKNVYTKKHLKLLSLLKLGKSRPDLKGRKRTTEQRERISKGRIGLTAKQKHPNWKGGITEASHLLRNSFGYKEWRKLVFKRDKWSCIKCGYRSKGKVNAKSDIEADHIKSFADFPELRLVLDNGRTLCVSCHKKITFKKS